jgi:hypothetical protein
MNSGTYCLNRVPADSGYNAVLRQSLFQFHAIAKTAGTRIFFRKRQDDLNAASLFMRHESGRRMIEGGKTLTTTPASAHRRIPPVLGHWRCRVCVDITAHITLRRHRKEPAPGSVKIRKENAQPNGEHFLFLEMEPQAEMAPYMGHVGHAADNTEDGATYEAGKKAAD